MNISLLEKSLKTFEKIKALDSEIIELDKIAMILANNKIEASFTLKVKDLTEDEKPANITIDADGSLSVAENAFAELKNRILGVSLFSALHGCSEKKEDKNTHMISHSLSNNGALHLLSVVLSDKQMQRDLLVGQLKNSGVKF